MVRKWCLAIFTHFSRSRSFLGSVQYSKGLEDKQFKMLEHDNPFSKYKANFDKCNNIWNRELFSRSRRKCEFLKSGTYLRATKNGGVWTLWPPSRKQTALSQCASALVNESQSKAAQGSLWVPLRVALHFMGGTWKATHTQGGAAASTTAGGSPANGAGNPRCRKSDTEYSQFGRAELLRLPANTFPFWTSGILWFASTDSVYG